MSIAEYLWVRASRQGSCVIQPERIQGGSRTMALSQTHPSHLNRLRDTGGFSTINAAAYPSHVSNSYIFQRVASVASASTFSNAGAASGARDTANPSNGYETPIPIALMYDSLRDQQLKKAFV